MTNTTDPSPGDKSAPRRRGRRPKGGKIVAAAAPPTAIEVPPPNIILHLRCKTSDLGQNAFSTQHSPVGSTLSPGELSPDESHRLGSGRPGSLGYQNVPGANRAQTTRSEHSNTTHDELRSAQDVISAKLRGLAIDLKRNNTSDTRSSCFWCTCAFDSPPVHIPAHRIDGTYQCYGCFCSPECAAAYLFQESLDTACRFERYHLLNHLYRNVYGYKQSIKPAPDPRYTLDKFYGNLTIEEFRAQSTRSGVLMVVDYPLTRVLPEIHMDIGEKASGFGGGTGRYQLRRRTPKSKAQILSQNFRMGAPAQ
jgi:hypothetical protein